MKHTCSHSQIAGCCPGIFVETGCKPGVAQTRLEFLRAYPLPYNDMISGLDSGNGYWLIS